MAPVAGAGAPITSRCRRCAAAVLADLLGSSRRVHAHPADAPLANPPAAPAHRRRLNGAPTEPVRAPGRPVAARQYGCNALCCSHPSLTADIRCGLLCGLGGDAWTAGVIDAMLDVHGSTSERLSLSRTWTEEELLRSTGSVASSIVEVASCIVKVALLPAARCPLPPHVASLPIDCQLSHRCLRRGDLLAERRLWSNGLCRSDGLAQRC